jgi:hypothetical protein
LTDRRADGAEDGDVRVHVLYFAILRERLGREDEEPLGA